MMKKYILPALTAIAAILFGACSNDDITINRKFTISVDASGVVTPFKNLETGANTNNLNTLNEGFRLRVRVIVYDSEGKAIVTHQQYRNSYLDAGTPFSMGLENGSYTFVAITDVVAPSTTNIGSNIWKLEDEDDINKAVLKYNATATQRYGILGIQNQQVNITVDTQSVILQPKPVGALLRVVFRGLKKAQSAGYSSFGLYTNSLPNMVDVDYKDAANSAHSTTTAGSLGGLNYLRNTSTSYDTEADYLFFLPCDIRMRFGNRKSATQTSATPIGETFSERLEAGIGYDITLDLNASDLESNSFVATFTQPSAGGAGLSAPVHSLRLADVQ